MNPSPICEINNCQCEAAYYVYICPGRRLKRHLPLCQTHAYEAFAICQQFPTYMPTNARRHPVRVDALAFDLALMSWNLANGAMRIGLGQVNDDSQWLYFNTGRNEFDMLVWLLHDPKPVRPLLPHVFYSTILRLGESVDAISFDEFIPLKRSFHASLIVSKGQSHISIDCRPSDALAMSVVSQAPIWVLPECAREARRAADAKRRAVGIEESNDGRDAMWNDDETEDERR